MDVVYCTRGDVNRWLPGGELVGTSRLVQSILASTDTIEIAGHGFETDDRVTFGATEGGTLPAPLEENVVYYAIRLTNGTFKVAALAGGDALDLTTDGSSVSVLRDPPYDDVIKYCSRFADGFLPAHVVPLAAAPNTPIEIKVVVAELAAKMLQNLDGKSSTIVDAARANATAQLTRYATGIPIRSATNQAPANLAITSVGSRDPRGWGSKCLP